MSVNQKIGGSNKPLVLFSITAVFAVLVFIIISIVGTLEKATENQASLLTRYLDRVQDDLGSHRTKARQQREMRFTQAKILRGEGRTLLHRHRGVDFKVKPIEQIVAPVQDKAITKHYEQQDLKEPTKEDKINLALKRLKGEIFEGVAASIGAPTPKVEIDLTTKRFIPVWELSDLKSKVYEEVTKQLSSKQMEKRLVFIIDRVTRPKKGSDGSVAVLIGEVGENGGVHYVHTQTVRGNEMPIQPNKMPKIVPVPHDSTVSWTVTAENPETLKNLSGETLLSVTQIGSSIGDLSEDERARLQVERGDIVDLVPVAEDLNLAIPASDLEPIVECSEDQDSCDDPLFIIFDGEYALG